MVRPSALSSLGAVLSLTACTSVLSPPATPLAMSLARGRCTIVVTRPGGDWSQWDQQLCDPPGQATAVPPPWLASVAVRAVDEAEVAACGASRCASHKRAVRFYVVSSPALTLTSQTDDEKIVVVLSSALVDRVGPDGGFYELAYAHELAYLRLGATCGEGVQSDDALRDLACDREALRWLAIEQPRDEGWTRRATILAEARNR